MEGIIRQTNFKKLRVKDNLVPIFEQIRFEEVQRLKHELDRRYNETLASLNTFQST